MGKEAGAWKLWQVAAIGLVIGVAVWLLWRWPGRGPEADALRRQATQHIVDLLQARSEIYWVKHGAVDMAFWSERRAAVFALGVETIEDLQQRGALADGEAWPPVDLWGHELRYDQTDEVVVFRSAGRDGVFENEDDVLSQASRIISERREKITPVE